MKHLGGVSTARLMSRGFGMCFRAENGFRKSMYGELDGLRSLAIDTFTLQGVCEDAVS
jgi:hypothetical protein